ncbi:MAG TPA: sortase [Patescibacteria group bacterium]|nr:sortase [Patescibacteria group bacterium]
MPPTGIIYQAPTRIKRVFYNLFRGLAAGVVAFSLVGLIFSFFPIVSEEISFLFRDGEVKSGFGDVLSRIKAQDADAVRAEAKDLGLDSYFSIHIPKIDAKEDIIANVDPGDKSEYLEALSEGIAHAKGTFFPGQGKNIYLFSHSTDSPLNFARYNAVFYLLGKLETGDRITIYFLDRKFTYEVTEKLVTDSGDTSWLEERGQGEVLILQTCYPPGTSLKRLIVVAVPK